MNKNKIIENILNLKNNIEYIEKNINKILQ